MPICSWENLLPGAGIPTISPSINPSADLTARTTALGAGGVVAGFDLEGCVVSAEDFVASTFCRDAQPNRDMKQTVAINQ